MHNAFLATRRVTRLFFNQHLTKPLYHSAQHITRRQLLTLAIETSCDDTCVAILERQPRGLTNSNHDSVDTRSDAGIRQPCARLHFDEKITAKNTGLGGIHPLEALDSHRSHLAKLVDKALLSLPMVSSEDTANLSQHVACRDGSLRQKPDFVSVTRGPGMRSNLSCGLEMAKGLAVAWQVPVIGVHHMQAHALTPRLVHAVSECRGSSENWPDFPFLSLLVSGGHTLLLYSAGLTEHKVLVNTADVAIGDALDRCGWILLPKETKTAVPDTAFGKHLSSYAFPDEASFGQWPVPRSRGDETQKPMNQFGWQMQTPLGETREMKFCFAGIESRVAGIMKEREHTTQNPVSSDERRCLAQTAIGCSFEHLGSRTIMALDSLRDQKMEIRNLVVSGGVAANDFLRYFLRAMLTARGYEDVKLVFPPVKYCTDNAAMIAWAGIEMYEAGYVSDFGIGALRKWSMVADDADGGIFGVGGWRQHNAAAESQDTGSGA